MPVVPSDENRGSRAEPFPRMHRSCRIMLSIEMNRCMKGSRLLQVKSFERERWSWRSQIWGNGGLAFAGLIQLLDDVSLSLR